ncbi:hypothetical protein AMTRI_Chr09g42280 [Amborella trichopoda]
MHEVLLKFKQISWVEDEDTPISSLIWARGTGCQVSNSFLFFSLIFNFFTFFVFLFSFLWSLYGFHTISNRLYRGCMRRSFALVNLSSHILWNPLFSIEF